MEHYLQTIGANVVGVILIQNLLLCFWDVEVTRTTKIVILIYLLFLSNSEMIEIS